MYDCFRNIVSFGVILSFLFIRCSSNTQPVIIKSPPGYNMKSAIQVKLPLELDEISGVVYYPVDSSIFAINDEKGWLYKIKKGRKIQRWKFSQGADFEDVVLLDSIFYVLQSNGNIMRLTFSGQNTVNVQHFYFDKTGQGANEFEILYYDPGKRKMILICKDCESDKKKSLTTFSFDPHSGQYNDSSFQVDVTKIAAAIGEEKIRFKPSAASINPKTGELFIISAINKLLVIADTDGHFKQAYKIDPGVFKQPEGLGFTPAGDLIISNEAADVGVADILFFTYQNKKG